MAEDWRDAYGLVRMTAQQPVVHRWRLDRGDRYALRTPCGIGDAEARSYTWALLANLSARVRPCRRCWR